MKLFILSIFIGSFSTVTFAKCANGICGLPGLQPSQSSFFSDSGLQGSFQGSSGLGGGVGSASSNLGPTFSGLTFDSRGARLEARNKFLFIGGNPVFIGDNGEILVKDPRTGEFLPADANTVSQVMEHYRNWERQIQNGETRADGRFALAQRALRANEGFLGNPNLGSFAGSPGFSQGNTPPVRPDLGFVSPPGGQPTHDPSTPGGHAGNGTPGAPPNASNRPVDTSPQDEATKLLQLLKEKGKDPVAYLTALGPPPEWKDLNEFEGQEKDSFRKVNVKCLVQGKAGKEVIRNLYFQIPTAPGSTELAVWLANSSFRSPSLLVNHAPVDGVGPPILMNQSATASETLLRSISVNNYTLGLVPIASGTPPVEKDQLVFHFQEGEENLVCTTKEKL